MKRTTLQLLQCIRCNQQRQLRYRQQLVSQRLNNHHVYKQKSPSALSNHFISVTSSIDNTVENSFGHKPAYHQGNSKYDIIRRDIYNWIASSEPTHFLTVQFPKNMRSQNLGVSKEHLRRLMARFEQSLIGSRWTKFHLPFFAFAEIGPKDGYTYHFHILFNARSYNTEQIQKSLSNACNQLSLSTDIFNLKEVETYEVIYYCLKEVKISNRSGCYDSIILSSDLFNISVK